MRVLVLVTLFLLPSSSLAQGTDSDERRLLQMHADVIRAHLENDIDLWMSLEAERYTSVNNGRISFPSVSDRRSGRSEYLSATTFDTYRDLRDPIVRISEDGSIGWLIAEVEVSGEAAGPGDEPQAFYVIWAWIETYEKHDGEWRQVGNASNRR